jgi:hypothetical protein
MSGVSSPQSRAELAQLRALVEKLMLRVEALEAERRKANEPQPEEAV